MVYIASETSSMESSSNNGVSSFDNLQENYNFVQTVLFVYVIASLDNALAGVLGALSSVDDVDTAFLGDLRRAALLFFFVKPTVDGTATRTEFIKEREI